MTETMKTADAIFATLKGCTESGTFTTWSKQTNIHSFELRSIRGSLHGYHEHVRQFRKTPQPKSDFAYPGE